MWCGKNNDGCAALTFKIVPAVGEHDRLRACAFEPISWNEAKRQDFFK
jgi:hypothetical protein